MYDSGVSMGHVIGFIIGLVLIIWGWTILNRKKRGVGYYILLILSPLIGIIVASCLSDKSEEYDEPSNDITDTNYQQ